jgi:hypothetical protein
VDKEVEDMESVPQISSDFLTVARKSASTVLGIGCRIRSFVMKGAVAKDNALEGVTWDIPPIRQSGFESMASAWLFRCYSAIDPSMEIRLARLVIHVNSPK